MRRVLSLAVAVAIAACSNGPTAGQRVLPVSSVARASHGGVLDHATIGFSVDTPQRAALAARQGITSTILYGGVPQRGSALRKALDANHISIVDGSISGYLDYWECYRTMTIKPPPSGYAFCYPGETQYRTVKQLLQALKPVLERDVREGAAGYWVLDDWASWDAGSARDVLPKIRAEIAAISPGKPAICGFGAGVGQPGQTDWDPGTGANYSNAGCDAVGWYNYSSFGITHPSNGKNLDWSMKLLLPAMARTLRRWGWNQREHPLIGIGQAWYGSYENTDYQPGLNVAQMRAQAKAFCDFGAASISWYAWDDSGDDSRTQTPNNSSVVAAGIAAGINACRQRWSQ